MTKRSDPRALVLVLGAVVSVQFGGALAATLVPKIGAAGSVTMRLLFSVALLLIVLRPSVRGYTAAQWRTVGLFGVALGLMNFSFYASLAHLPIGVAVTIEFIGPLLLATFLSRRARDLVAVGAAALGVVLISEITHVPFAEISWVGIGLALTAGGFWAAYVVLSEKTGAIFPKLDGLALALVVSTAVVLPFGIPSMAEWDRSALLLGLGIALLSSVIPYSLELVALRRIAAGVFGILLSLEPAVAALAGLIVLGQRLHPLQLLGMALVVAASIIVLGLGARPSDRPDPAQTAAT